MYKTRDSKEIGLMRTALILDLPLNAYHINNFN